MGISLKTDQEILKGLAARVRRDALRPGHGGGLGERADERPAVGDGAGWRRGAGDDGGWGLEKAVARQ